MKTNGEIVSIMFEGEEIGLLREFECDTYDLPEVISWSATVDFEYYSGAQDYFMKALMYALTYKN